MDEQSPLSGLHVLVVEDIFIVALDLSCQLEDLGCAVVGPASSVKQALETIDEVALDGAVLDVNLAGEQSFPVAQVLASRGIPFFFLTGYDSAAIIPKELQQIPRPSKPVDAKVLTGAVSQFRR